MIPRKLVAQVLERDNGWCVIAGCGRTHSAKGYCNLHYQRMLTHGDPLYVAPSMEERFWSKVEPTGFCWLWAGARDPNGYGVFNKGRKLDRAHRISYELLVGPIPAGLVLDHLCRNQSCCNPDHLEPVTQLENMRRNRLPHCQRGHSMDDAYERPDGNGRMCRTCSTERRKARTHGDPKKAR